jgi:hypothetical protein
MNKLKELYYRHLAKQFKRQKYYLYQATIYYKDDSKEVITDNKYTYSSKYSFVHYWILRGEKILYNKDDNTYVPICNIKEIKVEVLDEQYVWYIDYDVLEDMTLDEINEWNNDDKLQLILKYKKED